MPGEGCREPIRVWWKNEVQREKDIAGFLAKTFDLVSKNGPAVVLFILLMGSASALGVYLGIMKLDDTFANFGMGFAIGGDYDLSMILYALSVFALSLVAQCFLAMQYLRSNERLPAKEPPVLAYAGLNILSLLGLMVGFLFLIIPGIFLMVKWSASVGFLIGEGERVVDSLMKSWDATEGFGWQIFFGGAALGVGLFLFQGIAGGVAGYFGNQALASFVTGVVDSLQSAIFLAFGIAVYALLADPVGDIAEVFE